MEHPDASYVNGNNDGPYEANYNEIDQEQLHLEEELQENSQAASQGMEPSVEQLQEVYYSKGMEQLENLQLLDLSPLATWKLSSHKQGHGLAQLRDDSPNTYWQSDGSAENSMDHQQNLNGNQLNHPHYLTLQFSKRVSLERISIFTNYQLDESYTPLKIKIMAGSSNWDLTEVCVVNFEQPIGWSHIIFKGVRADGLLKCFVVKIIILANHQDGKDSHIRALRCFGKKSYSTFIESSQPYLLQDANLSTGYSSMSGILLNNHHFSESVESPRDRTNSFDGSPIEEEEEMVPHDSDTHKILSNVSDVIGFNSGFDSLELKSISSIR